MNLLLDEPKIKDINKYNQIEEKFTNNIKNDL